MTVNRAADKVERMLCASVQIDGRNVSLRIATKTRTAPIDVAVAVGRGCNRQRGQRLGRLLGKRPFRPSTGCDLRAITNLKLVNKAVCPVLIDKLQIRINRGAGVSLAARTAVQQLRPHNGSRVSIDGINLAVEFGDEEQVLYSRRGGDIA